MRPTVFLDIDGVLNTPKNYAEWRARHEEERTGIDIWCPSDDDQFVHLLFDAVNVAALNQVTDKSGAQVVVSSSWRLFYRRDSEKLEAILKTAGVKAEFAGVTPTIAPERWSAIGMWLAGRKISHDEYEAASFVILDDESAPSYFQKRQVLTNSEVGFVEVDRALRILGGGR